MFESGSDSIITQMKPYLLFMADGPLSLEDKFYDPVDISGTVRFTYT